MMKLPQCPVEITMIFLEERKKVLIIGYLLRGVHSPEDLCELVGDISNNGMLRRLNELEELGIVEQSKAESIQPNTEYTLTELGRNFQGILEAMDQWGMMHKKRIENR